MNMQASSIIEYAVEHGFSFESACAAIDLYRDDPDYYNEHGLAALLRHAAPESAPKPEPYIVRV
jgi:hypothetical protein